MHQQFEVIGDTQPQSLKTRLKYKSGIIALRVGYLLDSPQETAKQLSERATQEIKSICPVGRILCEVVANAEKVGNLIIRAGYDCELSNCPFGEFGGGSGDREPRNPLAPLDSARAKEIISNAM